MSDLLKYKVEKLTLFDSTIVFRAFRNIPYVNKPVNMEYQRMNFFVPEGYYSGEVINGYSRYTAPVFMPNMVGGYRAGCADEPGEHRRFPGEPNAVFRALQRGYVVAAPAIRGRTVSMGKAPALIIDQKAAIRFVRIIAPQIAGDPEKIITNGTSAGGALSALAGATGDHPDYARYLDEIGAAKGSDAVFAASCYCPITNLDHADMAYEWQFLGVNEYKRKKMNKTEGDRPSFSSEDGYLSELQIKISKEEARLFPAYVNSLNLFDESGNLMQLDPTGEGSFKEYVKNRIMDSGNKMIEKGHDLAKIGWLTIKDGKIIDLDFDGYVQEITRMKAAPAFDDVTMNSPENHEFGEEGDAYRHFTEYSFAHSLKKGTLAEGDVIKMMNPMNYIRDKNSKCAKYWRIRHGECDRDTSLAIPSLLTLMLQNEGCEVDFHLPWNVPHSGDYDLDELFDWIDGICK